MGIELLDMSSKTAAVPAFMANWSPERRRAFQEDTANAAAARLQEAAAGAPQLTFADLELLLRQQLNCTAAEFSGSASSSSSCCSSSSSRFRDPTLDTAAAAAAAAAATTDAAAEIAAQEGDDNTDAGLKIKQPILDPFAGPPEGLEAPHRISEAPTVHDCAL
ncbi:hypothetical protein, conserved [Eimeria tenella]|uniref:Uncharacterized protein n=1 Tax=Eimeria tenella TaxID=5802 RepID=U6KS17_EIMTE|nr:hypothetical protein, conserved [Eimeria tenella]CDJ39154.1 hypothetical protein, conserved [Eimeria tenella]|eukprot:XP_013229909.1 hypothetical protein, conserved [Eimeria tenella]